MTRSRGSTGWSASSSSPALPTAMSTCIALVQAGGMIAVNIVVIRGGQHVGDRTHFR